MGLCPQWGQGAVAEAGIATPHTAGAALDSALIGSVSALTRLASHAWGAGVAMSYEVFTYL
jgi:hypothetical protein